MKKQMSFIGLALLSLSSIHASFFSAPPVQPIEITPPILYPHGQMLNNSAFLIAAHYLGGYAGQIERRVATSGVLATRTPTAPTQGSPIIASQQWAQGFEIDFAGSTAGPGSHSFGLSYSFLTGNNNQTITNSASGGTPDILPSFAMNNATGATSIQSSVTTQYRMPSLQDGLFTYSRSLFANKNLSIMILTGIHAYSLFHKLYATYTDVSANVTILNMKEATYGAGPLVGFTSVKRLNDSFGLRGTFFASAPIAAHVLTQTDTYYEGGIVPSFGYNASGTETHQHFVAHIDLEAIYRTDIENGPCVEFLLGWHVKQYVNISYLTSMSNNQNASPSTVELNTLKAGIVFIF